MLTKGLSLGATWDSKTVNQLWSLGKPEAKLALLTTKVNGDSKSENQITVEKVKKVYSLHTWVCIIAVILGEWGLEVSKFLYKKYICV